MHFLEWKLFYFDSNFAYFYSWGANWHGVNIGLDYDLVPGQTFDWRMYASPALNELFGSSRAFSVLGELQC